ncbi:hypothetical protein PLEOSDRAFT_1016092, partial [Pleurotus ostreatus PC15]
TRTDSEPSPAPSVEPSTSNDFETLPFHSSPAPDDLWTHPDKSLDDSSSRTPLDPFLEEVTRPHLLVSISNNELQAWNQAYAEDPYYHDKSSNSDAAATPLTPSRFQRSHNGLVYFVDADGRYRLCVPRTRVNYILNLIHNSPHESAHSGEK